MKKINLILLIILTTFSCKVAKKQWVKENFTEKQTTTSLKESITASIETAKTELTETFTSTSNDKKTETSTTTKASENENTNVSGTITAEDGKEKSVTIGGTTITSNGANISFKTSTSKSATAVSESKYQELNKQLNTERQFTETLQVELKTLQIEFAEFVSSYENEKTIKSKEVKKTGFQFGIWIVIIIVVILIIVIWYFRKSIPFLK